MRKHWARTSGLSPLAAASSLVLRFNGVSGSGADVFNAGQNSSTTLQVGTCLLSDAQGLHYPTAADMTNGYRGIQCTHPGDNSMSVNDGAGAICYEGWFYPTSLTASLDANSNVLFSTRPVLAAKGMVLQYQDNGALQLAAWTSGGTLILNIVTTAAVVLNQWQHIAVQRLDDQRTWVIYVNGVNVGTGAQSNAAGDVSGYVLDIGFSRYSDRRFFDGYVDSFRVTQGLVRYTGNFTPNALV